MSGCVHMHGPKLVSREVIDMSAVDQQLFADLIFVDQLAKRFKSPECTPNRVRSNSGHWYGRDIQRVRLILVVLGVTTLVEVPHFDVDTHQDWKSTRFNISLVNKNYISVSFHCVQ